MSARDALLSMRKRIEQKARSVGRDPASVRLLAVSKLQSTEKIHELFAAGQLDFGENYVQELLRKKDELAKPGPRWHLIGHLQKNKAKLITGLCELIHSVDSAELAELLSRKAAEKGLRERILLQVNTGEEDSKEGIPATELPDLIDGIRGLPGLELHGLMTMPPLQSEASRNRPHFRLLRDLLVENAPRAAGHPWRELSMGTSHDWEVALEEGATYLRLGTVLFGERPKN